MSAKLTKPILSLVFFLLAAFLLPAQDKNPFQSIGKKGKIVTLTNGRYEELFDQDSIQQIGTVLVNVRQMKVVKLLKDEKEAQELLDNSTNSRFLSVDPLASSYPMLTPYQYASNSPILGVDMDGLEFYSSHSSRIAIGLRFDPKLKKISSFTTYYRSENLPDALNNAIEKANTCVNCIGSSAAQVAAFQLNLLNPFIKTEATAEAKDIDVPENSAVGASSTGSQIAIIPQNKKEAREQERNRTFFTEGASPRIAKVGAIMAAVDLAATGIQYLGNENLKSIVKTAQNQSLNGAVVVIGIIQSAIDNGKLEKYLDDQSLMGVANYLLFGGKIEKYQVVNGIGKYVEDKELTNIADQIWTDYMNTVNEKKVREELRQEQKPKVDNTRTGN